MLSDSCDGDEDDGSSEINGPVPVDEFGGFVADKHANGNKKFRDDYQVCFITTTIIIVYMHIILRYSIWLSIAFV